MRVIIVTEVHKVCRKSITFTRCAIIIQMERGASLLQIAPLSLFSKTQNDVSPFTKSLQERRRT